MQAKLLTAIEKRQILRWGLPFRADRCPADLCHEYEYPCDGPGRDFPQDLLYRINTIELHIPPLRERGNDVILLAEHFLSKYAVNIRKT